MPISVGCLVQETKFFLAEVKGIRMPHRRPTEQQKLYEASPSSRADSSRKEVISKDILCATGLEQPNA